MNTSQSSADTKIQPHVLSRKGYSTHRDSVSQYSQNSACTLLLPTESKSDYFFKQFLQRLPTEKKL